MTIDQAVAILEAERVLQAVATEGPDCNPGSAWHDYVKEAGRSIKGSPKWCNAFSDLDLLEDADDSTEMWRCPNCEDILECSPGYYSAVGAPFCFYCNRVREWFERIDTIFLRESDGVLAIFPGIAASGDLFSCFSRSGQHSSASLDYCEAMPEVTDPSEYVYLAAELNLIGYNVRVVSKDSLLNPKYADARRAQP